jgi:hypothetical protein
MAYDLSEQSKLKLGTEADAIKAAEKEGSDVLTEASVFARFGGLCFNYGKQWKGNDVSALVASAGRVFDAFDAKYRDASNGFRKPLEDSSKETWRSAFGNFAKAGAFKAWDIGPVVATVLDPATKGSYTTRGSRIGKVIKAFPNAKPTDAEVDAILNPPERPKENPLNDFANRLVKMVSDDALKGTTKNPSPLFAASRETSARLEALLKLRIALNDFERATQSKAGEEPALTPEEELAIVQQRIAAEKAAAANPAPTGPTN